MENRAVLHLKCMKIKFTLIVSFFGLWSLNSEAQQNQSDNNCVTAIEKIADSLKSKVAIVHFEHSTSVIFPKEYCEKRFSALEQFCFTPDTLLIKMVDQEIVKQYYAAIYNLNEKNWREIIAMMKADTDKEGLKKALKGRAREAKSYAKATPRLAPKLAFYDKQYVGYVTANGELELYINLIDFRDDPCNLKRLFCTAWINGWCGLYEYRVITLWYHVRENLVTINEDL